MNIIRWAVIRAGHHSLRWRIWRALLAAPFALSLALALILGPATIDSAHSSFAWLAAWSFVAALGMLAFPDALLILVGLATILAFPLLAGLGFHFAPAWADPMVAMSFYGSIAASLAGMATGLVAVLRPRVRAHPRAAAIAMGGIALFGLGAILVIVSEPAAVAGQATASVADVHNMGSLINTAQREAEPTFSADGLTMTFNCHDYDICVSDLSGSWETGQWSSPQLIGSPISTEYLEVEPWLSPAGDKLYFNSSRPFADGEGLPGLALYVNAVGLLGGELGITPLRGVGQDDIWVSYLTNGVWSQPRNLSDVPGEPPVNSAYRDHCLDFSADGNEAFWTSTRPGGFGGNDIWTSRRVNGTWTVPENLGPNVNSAASEHHSMPSPDGRSLHVTSDRSGGHGGEDMYFTTRAADGSWGPLTDLGSPINGPASDRCAAWTPDGAVFLFDSDRSGGRGSKDLWWVYTKNVTSESP